MILQVLDEVGLFLQKLSHVSSTLHQSNRSSHSVDSLESIRRKPRIIEFRHSADVASMDDEENECLNDCESYNVNNWTHVGL